MVILSLDLHAPLVPAEVDLRDFAAKQGKARYSDGKPCVHGHLGERYTRNAYCVECQRAQTRNAKARVRRLMGDAG